MHGWQYFLNLPIVDAHQKSNETEREKMKEKQLNLPQTGKKLAKIPVGTKVMYDKNPDTSKIKHPKWCKGMISDISNPRKYQILMDNDKVVTRSRCHIKGYYTHSGRVSKVPNRLIES